MTRALDCLLAPVHRGDLNSLEAHWQGVMDGTDGEERSEDERLTALRVAIPSLASCWMSTLTRPHKHETQLEWDERMRCLCADLNAQLCGWRREVKRCRRDRSSRHELDSALTSYELAQKKRKYLRDRLPPVLLRAQNAEVSPGEESTRSRLPLDRDLYRNRERV